MSYFAVHHGQMHCFDTYEEYDSKGWATYVERNGGTFGIETDAIAKTAHGAACFYITKVTRMVNRALRESREAADRAETWANLLDRFSLTGTYLPKRGET